MRSDEVMLRMLGIKLYPVMAHLKKLQSQKVQTTLTPSSQVVQCISCSFLAHDYTQSSINDDIVQVTRGMSYGRRAGAVGVTDSLWVSLIPVLSYLKKQCDYSGSRFYQTLIPISYVYSIVTNIIVVDNATDVTQLLNFNINYCICNVGCRQVS